MRTKTGDKERAILEAATAVFAQQGYYNAKISVIAEQAGVATGSVYLYFKNKETLLARIFEQTWQRLHDGLQQVVERQELQPVQKLEAMVDLVLDVFTVNSSLAMVLVIEQQGARIGQRKVFDQYYERFLDFAEKVVQEGIALGQFDEAIDPKFFRYFIFGSIRQLLHQWADDAQRFPLDEIRRSLKYAVRRLLVRTPA